MSSRQLPAQFKVLQPFADEWALGTELERQARRKANDMAALERFYDAVFPHMGDIAEYLDRIPLSEITGDDRNLLWLAFSFAEIAPAVDLFRQPMVPDGFEPERFPPIALDRFMPIDIQGKHS